jgi:hypothetical protein
VGLYGHGLESLRDYRLMAFEIKTQVSTDLSHIDRTDLAVTLYDEDEILVSGVTLTVGPGEQHTDFAVFRCTVGNIPDEYTEGRMIFHWDDDPLKVVAELSSYLVRLLVDFNKSPISTGRTIRANLDVTREHIGRADLRAILYDNEEEIVSGLSLIYDSTLFTDATGRSRARYAYNLSGIPDGFRVGELRFDFSGDDGIRGKVLATEDLLFIYYNPDADEEGYGSMLPTDSYWPSSITLPKLIEMTEVPGVTGAIATESVYEPIQVSFEGKLVADTGEEFRELVLYTYEKLEDPEGFVLEVWPGRSCRCYVNQHTLDPQWPGVNDRMVEFRFSVVIPDGVFFDVSGNTFRTP